MDRLIYLSMSGAKATMQRQETLANNLANVSTVGFRAELAAFRAVPVEGSGASTRVYALESTPGYDASAGQVARDRPQPRRRDERRRVARRAGRSTAPRRTPAPARSTSTPRARWSTASGLTVLGDGGPIQVPPDTQVAIGGRRHGERDRRERPQHVDRQAQAGDARSAAHARHRRPVPRGRAATSPPIRPRASRTARSKAPTSAPSRRWSR